MEKLLKYGLFENRMRHVSDVGLANGLACDCICPKCKQPLVAKNNPTNKMQAFFSHCSGYECNGAIETALHELAKQVFFETKCLRIPDYHYDYKPENKESVFKESILITFDEVRLEEKVTILDQTIIPDAIAVKNGIEIYIEFANTHFIDDVKKNRLKTSGKACIEIDITEQLLDENLLSIFFITNTPSKYWVINPKLDKEYSKYKEQQMIKRQQELDQENLQFADSQRKYDEYKYNSNYKLFESNAGRVELCPKKFIILKNMKSFYSEDILKRIIDGEYWNREIYGKNENGRWIFLKNNEKVVVYPPNMNRKDKSDPEERRYSRLYAGLNKIRETLALNSDLNHCVHCEFAVEILSLKDGDIQICSHPNPLKNQE